MGIDRSDQDVLAKAAAPVLERIGKDLARMDEPTRSILQVVREDLFEEALNVTRALARVPGSSSTRKTRFHADVGLPISKYIEQGRLETALRLLALAPEVPFRELSALVGYRLEHTFMLAFRRKLGVPPGEIRRQLEQKTASLDEVLRRIGVLLDAESRSHSQISKSAQSAQRDRDVPEEIEQEVFEDVIWPAIKLSDAKGIKNLATSNFRFSTEALFWGLLKMSLVGCRDDRERGVVMAEMAIDALWALRPLVPSNQYHIWSVEALANLGNAQRLASDFDAADRTLRQAEWVAAEHENTIPIDLRAKLLAYKAHLRIFERRFNEVPMILDAAEALLQGLEDKTQLIQLRLSRGLSFELQGDFQAALAQYVGAKGTLEEGEDYDSYLTLAVYQHLANINGLLGEFDESRIYLETCQGIADEIAGEEVVCRLLWMKGLLAYGEEKIRKAEQLLLEAKQGLLAIKETLHVAVLCLDIALLQIERHESTAARVSILEALPLLKTARLDREALVALDLLEKALQDELLTRQIVKNLREAVEIPCNAPRWVDPI